MNHGSDMGQNFGSSELEQMLGEISAQSAGEAPPTFIGRVRRRRRARLAIRGGATLGVITLVVVGADLMRTSPTPAPERERYASADWPAIPIGNTGGPVAPIRAWTRPTDPIAASLLQ